MRKWKDEWDYIDIGTNLFCEQFAGKEEKIIEGAFKGKCGMIITGSSLKSSLEAVKYISGRKDELPLFSTVGIHPHAARTFSEDVPSKMRTMIEKNPFVVAVGECGLDYDRMFSPKEDQIKAFEKQLDLALELDKPVFLHEREAADDFYDVLKNFPSLCKKAVVHCYTGSRKDAERYLNLGCKIGITGWVCDDRRNADLLDALEAIPAESLMIETDAPYLLPRGIKGLKNPNVPENIRYVCDKVAVLKKMDREEFRKKVFENTVLFFGLDKLDF